VQTLIAGDDEDRNPSGLCGVQYEIVPPTMLAAGGYIRYPHLLWDEFRGNDIIKVWAAGSTPWLREVSYISVASGALQNPTQTINLGEAA
jgi:hypothetical protein